MKIQRPIFLQVEHALSRAGIASYPAWLNVPRWARSPHREEPDSAGGGLSSEGLVVAAACSGPSQARGVCSRSLCESFRALRRCSYRGQAAQPALASAICVAHRRAACKCVSKSEGRGRAGRFSACTGTVRIEHVAGAAALAFSSHISSQTKYVTNCCLRSSSIARDG
jgi:hypothetical protein